MKTMHDYWLRRMGVAAVWVAALLGWPLLGTAGTWTPVVNPAPDNIDTMLLLSDGTVMAASGEPNSGAVGSVWYRLTPDNKGSYANGKWTTLAPMHDTRLYFASQVLQDGRVFVAGAEYGTGSGTAEIYDPLLNTWTLLPDAGQTFLDCESRTLPNGSVLVSPVFPNPPGGGVIYNPNLNSWSAAGINFRGTSLDEASWIKLPDDSILTLDFPGTGLDSERYIPSLNQWVNDGTLPGSPWDLVKFEMGAGFLLPDGRGFYLGSSGTNVFYKPSGNNSPGTFSLAAISPNGQGTPDAPAAMLVTGRILCTLAPSGTNGGATNFPGPTTYYEFDPVANTFNSQPTPTGGADTNAPYINRMLDLPDGTVLFSTSTSQLYIYKPLGNPVASGKPTIFSITPNSDGSFLLTGTGLNGISEGAQYGDDAQMDSNYPIIRLTDANGKVYYVRTHHWSSTSVMTGSQVLTTRFNVPSSVPPGIYSLVVTANGISSDPVQFTGVAAPNLIVTTNIVVGGNGNGLIDPDECNSLYLVLTNNGAANATTVHATLSTSTPGVIIVQSSSAYPDIPVGGSASNLTAFQISTTPSFIAGSSIALTLVVKCDQTTTPNIFPLLTATPGFPFRFDNSSVVPIPSTATGVSSTINVNGISTALAHVTVLLNVLDPVDSALTLQLIGPDNTSVILTQGNGGTGANFGSDCLDPDRTTFDDTASIPVGSGNAPFIGSFQPTSPLGAFVGKSGNAVNGNWQLLAVDPRAGTNSAIQCWSLVLTPSLFLDGGGQCPGVDLSLGMTATPNPATLLSNITYTMVITNHGPDTATSVALNQLLPQGVTFISGTSTQGQPTAVGNSVSCDLGTMLAGSTATISVVVKANTVGTQFSTASVGAQQTDLNLADNSANVAVVVNPPAADLGITLQANPDPALLNGLLTYTVIVTNYGPFTATNVVVTNTLDPSLLLVQANPSQGSASSVSNLVIANLGNLAVGSNATISIQVKPQVAGAIKTKSQVVSALTDPNAANNTASITSTVTAAADLAVTIAGPSAAIAGSNVTITVTVQNLGLSVATGVTLRDNFGPTGLVVKNSSATSGSVTVTNSIATCIITNLGLGASSSMTLTFATTNFTGSMLNNASVNAAQADPNTNNNAATLVTVVSPPTINVVAAGQLLTSESFQPPNGMIEPGETVTLLLRLQNLGNIDTGNNLTATLMSTGGVTPANGSQVHNYGTLTNAGGLAGQPFTFTASGTNGGAVVATLALQNNGTNLPSVSFTNTLPGLQSFTNANNITIPDHGQAAPYPSTIAVSGVTGIVGRVTVTMTNVNHTYPDDLDMLLVGPLGQTVLLMSHCGDSGVLTNISLTLDDGAVNGDSSINYLPTTSQIIAGAASPISSGTYAPAHEGTNNLPVPPTPAPQNGVSYSSGLVAFDGTNPNGNWKLFVYDRSPGDQGIIVGGWSLNITSGSAVNPVVDLAVTGNALPNPVLQASNLTYTFTITNNGPNPATAVQFTNILPANTILISATNSAKTPCLTNGGMVVCSFPTLNIGSNITVTVVVAPLGGGSLVGQATVSSSDADPLQSNNSVTVSATATAQIADLGVTLGGATNAVQGGTVVYMAVVTNNGPNTALNVVVTDALQPGLSFVSGTSNGSLGNPSVIGSNAVCNLGNLAPGTGAVVTFSLTSSLAGTLTNIVSLSATSSDPQTQNNSASVITTFSAPAPHITAAGAKLIAPLPSGAITPGQSVNVSLLLANDGTADTTNLMATLQTNSTVLPAGLQQQAYGALFHGGPATAMNFAFTAAGTNGGVLTATLQLADGAAGLQPVSFTFNLPATNTYANTNAIIIPDHGPANPYPATITITNGVGVVSRAMVTLSNFNHQFPNDVQVVLAAPSGRSVVLMAGTGGGLATTNVTLAFDDTAASALPASSQFAFGTAQLVSGVFRPSNDGLALAFPSPAPPAPYPATLASLNGVNPNGTWTLFVFDNSPGDSGSIAAGWTLNLATVDPVNLASDIGLSVVGSPAQTYPGQPITLTATVTNLGPAVANNVTVSNLLPAGLSYVSTSLGSYSSATNGALLFNSGSLAVGASTTFTITLTALAPGGYVNPLSLYSDQTDVDPGNNSAQTSIQVLPLPQLSAKAVTTNGVFGLTLTLAGQAGTYNIQSSTNLTATNWTYVTTVNIPPGAFTDTNIAGSPAKYYRAVLVP